MKSRRPVNSDVMLLHPINVMRIVLVVIAFLVFASVVYGQDTETRLGNPITREQILEIDRPSVVRATIPAYPAIAAARRISGTVMVDVDINPTGTVTEARVIIGEKLLRDSARKAALRWQFNATNGEGVRSVRLTFIFHEISYVAPEKKPQFTSPYQVEVEWMGTADSFPAPKH